MLLLSEAAADVGVSPERMRQLVKDGRLKARRRGRFYMVFRSELERFKMQPRVRTGRPRKAQP